MKQSRRRGVRRPRHHYWPSEDIRHIDDIPPGTPTVLYCRVSGSRQDPEPQTQDLIQAAAAAGLPVVGERCHTGPAGEALAAIREAAILAAEHGGVVLATGTTRFARAAAWQTGEQDNVRAGQHTIKEVCEAAGVPLVTVLHPDTPPREEREYHARLGRTAKPPAGRTPNKRPGYKKRRRLKLLPRVLRMRLDGYSNRGIGRELGVAEKTVRDWLKRCDA
ncbi:helix-turn-helix domain-containing protein [Algisphaera agarilytica]|uniref:DNA invertase Pin-like site-specific DNA recombinase n=1 Tax=Algisphaera agarilytica TaxID=1385975 RepID=A0A7X0LMD8_9BACT|nr:helix-turn-helix domain-containing protein [Algisphaera agarilytica]MBB6431536.1 DNA invertase Pin-like site-specific DNA recombinase [Algisphaera agarilytica]